MLSNGHDTRQGIGTSDLTSMSAIFLATFFGLWLTILEKVNFRPMSSVRHFSRARSRIIVDERVVVVSAGAVHSQAVRQEADKSREQEDGERKILGRRDEAKQSLWGGERDDQGVESQKVKSQ